MSSASPSIQPPVLAWHFHPAALMLLPIRLALGSWLARSLLRIRYRFSQRSQCDSVRAS
ncbi:MAG: hypothetical protein WCP60_07575 [bacterium]